MDKRGRWFDSQSSCYLVVSFWIGDYLWTGKPSQHTTNTKAT